MNNQQTFYWKPVNSEKDLPDNNWEGIIMKYQMGKYNIVRNGNYYQLTEFIGICEYLCPTTPAPLVSGGLPSTDECIKFAEAMPNGLLIWDEVIELIKFCQTPIEAALPDRRCQDCGGLICIC